MVSVEELLQPDKAPLLGVALAVVALAVGTIYFVSTRKPKPCLDPENWKKI